MQAKHGKNMAGFTLLEIMIALVIVSIISAMAISMYTKYTIRAHREDVKTQMLQIAQHLQTYKAVNGSYTGAVISNVSIFGGNPAVYPQRGTAYYTMGLALANGGWTLTATTIDTTPQINNGIVVLNDEGQKCWLLASTNCSATATTTWDGK